MNYYTYTIRFVDGHYYHGYAKSRGRDPLTDGYFGTPVTNKGKWLTTMYWKEITGTYETLEEVTFAEQESIRPVFNTDPYCLNANCNGVPTLEQARKGAIKAGRKSGAHHKANNTAVCDPINQEKGRQTARDRGSGFYDEEFQQSVMMKDIRKKNGKKSGDLAASSGQLAEARAKIDPEKRRKAVQETARRLKAEGRGLSSIPYEIRAERSSEVGKKVCASKWMDPDHPELGIHNPGNLVKLQRKMGYPSGKENKIRLG